MSPRAVTPLVLLLLLALAGGCSASGFWNSRFSTSEFAKFHYLGRYTVTIFQHVRKNSTFYFTPLVLLDHQSGRLTHNTLTEFHELRLQVVMWSRDLKDKVYTFLRGHHSVRRPSVKVLPLEKIRFAWRSRRRQIKRQLLLEDEFQSMHHTPSRLTLTLASRNASEVRRLDQSIRANPEMLDGLELDCFMTTKKSAMKTVTVTIQHLMKSRVFANLLNLPPDGNYNYLRVDDFNSLAQETFTNVKATTIRSTEYVDKSDEINIMSLIQGALRQGDILSSSLSEGQWDSVFWDPTFARPDRVLREANRSFTFDGSSGRLTLNRGYLRSNENARRLFSSQSGSSYSVNGGWWTGYASFHSSQPATSSSSESISRALSTGHFNKSTFNSLSQGRGLSVEWNGERFVVKPMRLVRVNRRSFESRRNIVSESMQLTLYEQTISLKVQILQSGVANFSVLAGGGTQSGGFPTDHSYCLLSNGGSCPPGFTRSRGHVKGIHMDVETAGNIMKGQLGDSSVRCHSPGDGNDCSFTAWEPYKAEIHLVVCCR